MMLEVMAKEAKKNDLILRSSGSVNANGFDNSASVFSKRGEKWVNQDCFLVWELLMCWRHAGLARMRQDLGLLFLSCSFPRVDASRPLKRYWGSGANQRLCLPVLDPIPALAGRCSFLREVRFLFFLPFPCFPVGVLYVLFGVTILDVGFCWWSYRCNNGLVQILPDWNLLVKLMSLPRL
ncbi:hypothetical protein RHGRI_015836 [Rhododendron griersonianum]|nr:hypothetical protein RHGRI_015836 [Rhododendron griersonianum]KAG5542877.1 hypothetical protein RHGRI_015836 [Rhododendron griersonianum]